MDRATLAHYARVLLTVGTNLQKGQCLRIAADPVQSEFLLVLSEEAYKMGARYVHIECPDPRVGKARVMHSTEEHLDYTPPYLKAMQDTMVNEDWALLRIDGVGNPDLMKDAPTERNSRVTKALSLQSKDFQRATFECRIAWTVAAMASPGWAAKVLNKPASEAAAEELWKILVPILKLDTSDPLAAWKEHGRVLTRRVEALNAARLKQIHFQGPGTDLRLGMIPSANWVCAAAKTQSGRDFWPNLPSEEVFTVPDYRETYGRVAVTRPVKVLENQVKGAWFQFDKGQVVDFGAEEGAEYLEHYFRVDEGSRYLGEVALVDVSSPIFQSGRVFESILFDENAACHIALGRGIGMCLTREDQSKKDDALRAMGFNVSIQHRDFMIGSEHVSVSGVRADGSTMKIIDKGRFSL